MCSLIDVWFWARLASSSCTKLMQTSRRIAWVLDALGRSCIAW